MSSSNKTTSAEVPVGDMRFPNIFPRTRGLLEKVRRAINNKLDPLLDRSVVCIYAKMGEISGKVKKIF